MIDLHTHTTFSDGSMTPEEVVGHAISAGLKAISITDHDTLGGLPRAMEAGNALGLEVVPGIELSSKSKTETHILGYYIDVSHGALNEALEEIQRTRALRALDTARNLRDLGFDIEVSDGEEFARGALLGRAHFAMAMVKKGYSASVKEAFADYLSAGRPAYSDMQLLTPAECVKLINAAGGLAFVAHLHTTGLEGDELVSFLKELKDAGLTGIEGFYSEYSGEQHKYYMSLARELGLAVSGGTDFHADMKPHIAIGKGLGNLSVPYEVLDKIKEIHRKSRDNFK